LIYVIGKDISALLKSVSLQKFTHKISPTVI